MSNEANNRDAEIRVEPVDQERTRTQRRADLGSASPPLVDHPYDDLPASMSVREEDLEPHAGLRYVARLFKILSLLLILLLIAEVVIGLVTQGQAAIPTLLVEATRLIVFAGLLWGAADMALMLIESNHDLRATRILVGRLNGRIQRLEEGGWGGGAPGAPPPGARPTPPREEPPRRGGP